MSIPAVVRWLLLCIVLAGLPPAQAATLRGNLVTHDPSTIVRDGDTWFNFSTGRGIGGKTSADLVEWAEVPSPVFSQYPAWIYRKIPNFTGDFWAPDVIRMNGFFYLYYSVSTFGTSKSAIGVVRSASLVSPRWEDLGIVVESFGGRDEINAIDPALFRDQDGRVYLSWGSYFGGIGVAEINQASGKLASAARRIYGGGFSDVEGAALTRDGPWYYLFVNRGACCKGVNSTYRVDVLRSTSILGPYAEARTLLPVTDGRVRGPGHFAVMKHNACHLASIHYYDLADGGTPKLDLLKLTYANGWPQLTRNFEAAACSAGVPLADGVYRLVARHSNQALDIPYCSGNSGVGAQQWGWLGSDCQRWRVAGDGSGSYTVLAQHSRLALDACSNLPTAPVRQAAFTGSRCQKWRIEPAGGGDFRVVDVNSNRALEVQGASMAPGAPVVATPWAGRPSQLWRVEPVSSNTVASGTYRLTPAHSGQALDLQNCSPAPEANVQQWPWNNTTCQKWSVMPTSNGHFRLASTASGMNVQAAAGSLDNGGNVNLGTVVDDGRQDWGFEAVGGGFYRITNRRSGRALEVGACSTAAGSNVQQWEWLATPCQMWKLEPAAVP